MKVLVIGSGGREHALAWKLAQSPRVSEVLVAPGNAGTATESKCRNVAVKATDIDGLLQLAQDEGIALTVVGPEQPLVAGVVDAFRAQGRRIFGPTAKAAQLEGSKAYAKDFLQRHGIPTAFYAVHTEVDAALAYIREKGAPIVVKADGLAAGKGVVVTDDRTVALDHARACLGKDGGRVVVEEYLDGPEVSLFCITDGEHVVPLQPAQDFKRVFDGDLGPNTGGMGAYSPLPWAPADLVDDVVARVVQPTVDVLRHRGTPFVGLVYAGLALTSRGLRVIEFNARFGDPETQVVLARLQTPLGHVLSSAATGTLGDLEPLRWSDGAAVTVVVAAQNYPDTPVVNTVIKGLEEAEAVEGAYVLHAGTKAAAYRTVVSSGGRILSVVGTGTDLASARETAYEAVDRISIAGSHHRSDIALAAELGEISVP